MFERYAPAITSFCRHRLGSREEAEEAVQHTFAAAYQSLLRDDRDMALKPWLYKIARNHCISILRERPDHVSATPDLPTTGLAEHVERRADLRALLRDLSELPEDQREALLMTEISGLTHKEVGRILGCQPQRVKGLVYRARRNLIEWRDARETPCDQIREQLAILRGTELRRNELRHHLRVCPGCREFLAEVREQRRRLAVALPVAPTAGLKAGVLGAVGLGGGGSAAGALSAIGAAAPAAGTTVAQVAAVVIAVGGGAAITQTAVRDEHTSSRSAPGTAEAVARPGARDAGHRLADAPTTPRSDDGSDGAPADRAAGDRAPEKRKEPDSDGAGRKGAGGSEGAESEEGGDGPLAKQNQGKGHATGQTDVSGPKAKKGNQPSQAGHRNPAPAPKGADKKPDQGADAGGGGPPRGGNAPGPKGPADKPKPDVQLPSLDPGGDAGGLGVELLGLLGG